MPDVIRTYRVGEILDSTDPQHRFRTPKGVRAAVGDATQLLPHALSAMEPVSAALTLLFVFHPTDQPHAKQSRLSLYIVVRAKDQDTADALSLLIERGPLAEFYLFERVEEPDIPWDNVNAICSIVRKEDRIEPLYGPEYNAKIPPAYHLVSQFEPNEENDFLTLDSVLDKISEPVVVSICVEPVDLSSELTGVTAYGARLKSINHPWGEDTRLTGPSGLMDDEEVWRYRHDTRVPLPRRKEPLAESVERELRKILESLHMPHLLFHVHAMAQSEIVARLIASVVAESAFKSNRYQVYLTRAPGLDFARVLDQAKAYRMSLVHTLGSQLKSMPGALYSHFARLAQIATPRELSGIVRLPLGSYRSPRCIRQNTDPPLENPEELLTIGYDEKPLAGESLEAHGIPRGILWTVVAKHLAIFGMPGSGKTTSLLSLMMKTFARGIPFIFFAPIGGEQSLIKNCKGHPNRRIRDLAQTLRVFTPGNNDVSPLSHNPLRRIPEIPLDQHIDALMECFKGSVPMFPALEGILREAMYLVFEEQPDPEDPPQMAHLVEASERILGQKGYEGEVRSNLRAAIDVRLGRLCLGTVGCVFQCGEDIPAIDDLAQGAHLIELSALPVEETAKLILFYLKALRDFLTATPYDGKGLRLVILIDESHLVVGRQTGIQHGEDFVDPKSCAAQQVCRLLAEFRKLGVGVVLADQSPSAVSPEVVKLTGSKLAFRTVEQEDRETLGGAMLFTSSEMDQVSQLAPGEAFWITEGYRRPQRIWTTDLSREIDLSRPPTNAELCALIGKEPWCAEAAEARSAALLGRLLQEMDRFDARRMALAREAVELRRSPETGRNGHEARRLLLELRSALVGFINGPYRDFLGQDTPSDSPPLRAFRTRVRDRFDGTIFPDSEKCLQMLELFANHT